MLTVITVVVLEAAGLLVAIRLTARWRAQALRAAREARRTEAQARRLADLGPAPGTRTLPAPGRRAVTALDAQDALDLLLLTRYVLDRADAGSALARAARRVRTVGETAALDLRLHPDLRHPGAER